MGTIQETFATRVHNDIDTNVCKILSTCEGFLASIQRLWPEDFAEYQALEERIKELWNADDGVSLKEFRTVVLKERDFLIELARKLKAWRDGAPAESGLVGERDQAGPRSEEVVPVGAGIRPREREEAGTTEGETKLW